MKLIERTLLFFWFSFVLLLSPSFAMEAPKENACRTSFHDPSVTICLNAEDFHHIKYGDESASGFSGGHDFGIYRKHHLKKNHDASVYFDRNMTAYIVSSTKGDPLPTIISNLQEGKYTTYHTLFPPALLSREFILGAFEQALSEKDSIDWHKGLFFTTFDGLSVAGFFIQRAKTFFIKTIFPDLSWYYRKDFGKHRHEAFAISRFLEWDGVEDVWLQHGNDVNVFDDYRLGRYLPEPIIRLVASETLGGNLEPEEFALIASTRATVANEYRKETLAVLDLFFDDPAKPTMQEFELLRATINDYCPTLRFVIKKKDEKAPVLRKYNLLKLALKQNVKDKLLPINLVTANLGVYFMKGETLGFRGGQFGLQLAEEILFQSLFLEAKREKILKVGRTLFESDAQQNLRMRAAEIVARNFTAKLINDGTLRKKLQDKGIVFLMRIVGKGKGTYYGLELISTKGFSDDKSEEEMNQMGVLEVKGDAGTPFEISFLPFTLQQVKKGGEEKSLEETMAILKLLKHSS